MFSAGRVKISIARRRAIEITARSRRSLSPPPPTSRSRTGYVERFILTTDDDEVVVAPGWIDWSDSFAELGNFFLAADERVQQGHECQELRSGTGLSEARPEVRFRTGRRD